MAAFLFLSASHAQILNPVRFAYSAVKKTNNTYEVHIKTSLQPKWHIYSVKNPDGGAEPTKIKVNEGSAIGAVREKGKLKTAFEKEFNVNQKFYEDAVEFVQLVKLSPADKKITGNIVYMVCNDKQCLPPKEVEFSIKL